MKKSELKSLILECKKELTEESSAGDLQKLLVELSKVDIKTANKISETIVDELGDKLTPEVKEIISRMFEITTGIEDWA
jgi:hypothetical protein